MIALSRWQLGIAGLVSLSCCRPKRMAGKRGPALPDRVDPTVAPVSLGRARWNGPTDGLECCAPAVGGPFLDHVRVDRRPPRVACVASTETASAAWRRAGPYPLARHFLAVDAVSVGAPDASKATEIVDRARSRVLLSAHQVGVAPAQAALEVGS